MGMKIPKIGRTLTTAMLGAGLLAILHAFVVTPDSAALDNPHTPDSSPVVNCGNCHSAGSPADFFTDQENGVCGQCHYPGAGAGMDAIPHSAPNYGGTKVQCTECHNPHYQRQSRWYKDASYQTTGLVTAIDATHVTSAGAGWAVDQWAGYYILPDKRYTSLIYKISGNTTETITIATGTINLTYCKTNATFAIVYGKLIKEYIRGSAVRFFRSQGTNSFADYTPTVDGVCQVCHTQTADYNRSGALNVTPEHQTDPDMDPAKDCTGCHNHEAGMTPPEASCTDCHGNPPSANVTGPPGLVGWSTLNTKYPPTGAISPAKAGAHVRHATDLRMMGGSCKACHSNSVMPTVDKKVDIGFQASAANYPSWKGPVVNGGTFNGWQTLASWSTAAYSWNAASLTTVNRVSNYNSTCSVYCHGSTLTAGTNVTPSWTTASGGACGTCHGANATTPPTTGSHTKHASSGQLNIACTECHGTTAWGTSTWGTIANNHVNGSVSWVLNTANAKIGANAMYWTSKSGSTGGLAPSATFRTCSNLNCHSSGQSADGASTTPYSSGTPTWGDPLSCGATFCHPNTEADGLASGSHAAHLGTQGVNGCANCHTGATNDGSSYVSAQHYDDTVDVAAGLTYADGTTALGNGFGSCSTAYCHSNGLGVYKAATWGTTSTGCSFCHNALPTTAAHGKHVTSAAASYGGTSVYVTGGAYDFGCGNCHPKSVTYHMNGTINVLLNDGSGGDTLKVLNDPSAAPAGNGNGLTCNKVYCHSNGTAAGLPSAVSLAWGTTAGDSCGHCHGNQPGTGSHAPHVVGIHYNNIFSGTSGLAAMGTTATAAHGNPATSTTINCNVCHNTTVTSSANDKNTVCAGCHGVSAGLKGNAAIAAGSNNHLNGGIDVSLVSLSGTLRSKAQLRTTPAGVWTQQAGYKVSGAYDYATMAPADWTAVDKSCTTACHNNQTITWGEANVTCSNCHKGL